MQHTDPIESVLDGLNGVRLDDHIVHLCSWSDVVKNDLRKALDRDDDYINKTLTTLIKGALDSNGRYHHRSAEGDEKAGYSANYVRVQCLLAEWLCIYRAVKVYLDGSNKSDDEVDLDNFSLQTG